MVLIDRMVDEDDGAVVIDRIDDKGAVVAIANTNGILGQDDSCTLAHDAVTGRASSWPRVWVSAGRAAARLTLDRARHAGSGARVACLGNSYSTAPIPSLDKHHANIV